MIPKRLRTTLFTAGLVIFTTIYSCLALWYTYSVHQRKVAQFEIHATIISYDLWNLNDSGMRTYLSLIADKEHFQSLEVQADNNRSFLSIQGPALSLLDRLLCQWKLIRAKEVQSPILYQGNQIGTLQGFQYSRTIYGLFYLFCIQFFLVVTGFFIMYLIRNRKLLEEQVQERTKRYLELVSLLPEMVLELDGDGTIVFANEKAINRFGLLSLEKNRYKFRDYVIMGSDKHYSWKSFLEEAGEHADTMEFRARDLHGHHFPVLVRASTIRTGDLISGARVIIVDITERTALEEQLNRDQKMKAIGMMAGSVAHDLNNILSGIVNYPEILLHKLSDSSPLRTHVHALKDAGLRAAAVVADLLTVARGAVATRETASLNDIVQQYLQSPEFQQLSELYPEITYQSDIATDPIHISCSIIHVRKCLMNLTINGSEAITGAGRITIATRRETIDTDVGTTLAPGDYALLSIQDSGSGISPQDLERIFEPFYSKKEMGRSGTGLGLAVVQNTMQDHDGTVTVETGDTGSIFKLYFPVSGESPEAAPEQEDWQTYKGQGKTILIIDDEPQQRDIASQFLRSMQYRVYTASSGQDALELLAHTDVDLLVLDMIIGQGMNGLETYRQILTSKPEQKAIIISGYSESSDVIETMRLGAGQLLNKPYTQEQLITAVYEEVFSKPAASANTSDTQPPIQD